MHLKTSYVNICQQLCPSKIEVQKYNLTPIPVQILDLVALSFKENYFTKIEIWYDEKSPDPFAIGVVCEQSVYPYNDKNPTELKNKNRKELTEEEQSRVVQWSDHSWNAKYYLIGKWADVKRSWKDLKEMAIERFIGEKGNEFRKTIKEAQRGLEDLETLAFEKFN